MSPVLLNTIQNLSSDYARISQSRVEQLIKLSVLISTERKKGPIVLNFICTHNSRRSQMSQAWALAAIRHFKLTDIKCVSGGTEVTEFNHRAVNALLDQGFSIEGDTKSPNPGYVLSFSESDQIEMQSKTYHEATPDPFIAIMTCDHADRNCPIITGAKFRFSLPFADPGHSDGNSDEQKVYFDTANLIGLEMLYLFSMVRENLK